MVNVDKHIDYWKSGAEEDWHVACELIGNKRHRHGLFFLHLALEKVLKAHVCRETKALAPKTHNLVRLAELAKLSFSEETNDLLAEVNTFNIANRYPEEINRIPDAKSVRKIVSNSREVYKWLIDQL